MLKGCQKVANQNVVINQKDNVWEDDGVEIVYNCGRLPQNFVIAIKPLVKEKIEALMEEYPNIEWLAYLIGDIYWDDKKAFIEDLVIPENQKTTTASVNDVDKNGNNSIGVIHSHHKMGFGFSKIDWEYINLNNTISIVIFDNGKQMEASVKMTTNCGAISFITDPTIKFITDCNFDKESFIEDAKSKINTNTISDEHSDEHFDDQFNETDYELIRELKEHFPEDDDPVEEGLIEVYDLRTGNTEYYNPKDYHLDKNDI